MAKVDGADLANFSGADLAKVGEADLARVSGADLAKVGSALRHLILASDHLRTALAAQLHVNVTELTALGHLAESEELTPKHLAQLLGITTSSVTGMVDHLEAAGFIYRAPNPADRRSILLHHTPAGAHAMQWVYEQYHAALALAFEQGTAVLAPDVATFLQLASDTLSKAALAQPKPGPRPRRQ